MPRAESPSRLCCFVDSLQMSGKFPEPAAPKPVKLRACVACAATLVQQCKKQQTCKQVFRRVSVNLGTCDASAAGLRMSWRQTNGSDAALEAFSAAAIKSSAASKASWPFQSSCVSAYKLARVGCTRGFGVHNSAMSLPSLKVCQESVTIQAGGASEYCTAPPSAWNSLYLHSCY